MTPSPPTQNIKRVQSPAGAAPLGPNSTRTICTSCGQIIFTNTSRKATSSAWLGCILLCIFGCVFGCCLIPFFLDSCNVVNHNCPNCYSYLGQYRP
ncbi:lipopolysaccharide-induced tumor necrosis factor-alpha factor homolog [Metopolophium dirhodum]|uniref:lipopolysaccharide-induced tumor necrosis factor-alpha factor homolog n=1 Tax=Metopolophium dirhodum TaxID=44670 RepID=UPI00298F4A28|nr:lipopolysaccharide-induced tumor necrosis factor-alpha factor homolog [Metopolophium dirhodum]